MHNITYRSDIKKSLITACVMLLSFFLLLSCRKKDVEHTLPVIMFAIDSGYTAHDTVLMEGRKIKIGINAWGAHANLTYFSIRYNDGVAKIILDTGINRSALSYDIELIKTSSPVEKWTFFIMDRNRYQDSIQIKLTKSTASDWGRIITRTDILLGAQENADTGSFFSFPSGQIFNLSQAFMNQAAVDLVYYFGQYEGTLASPAEAEAPGFFAGLQGIANWTIKNETRYDTTSILPQVFDDAGNDSLLLSAYDPGAGKRKAKFLKPDMVLSFKSPSGKLGLIKVTQLSGTTSGSLQFSVKIQE